jgi:hypothetical protein
MLKNLIRLIALLCSMIVASQTTTVKGIIMNQNNKPVELVEVIIVNKDSIALKSEFTNSKGIFEIQTEKGEYVLKARENGKIVYKQTINLMDNLDLGNIKIIENKKQLDEVVVTSKKKLIERKVDRLVFNVENSISATGGDAIDALKVTPSIKIQNDEIKMIGKSGLAVMIDDRLIQLSGDDLINYLKTIKSDDIKSIEVITTPPAKYSAEGNSGLINIKLKKAKKDSWNATVGSGYRQATYASGNVGGNFNYQKNKVTVFSNANFFKGSNGPIETSKVYFPDQLWHNYSKRRDQFNALSGRIGLDYQLTKKWSMGIQSSITDSKPIIRENNLTTITNNSANTVDSFIKTDAENFRKGKFNAVNWHTIYNIDTLGTKLSVDFDYFKYNGNDNRTFSVNRLNSNNIIIPDDYFAGNNGTDNRFTNYAGKIDVEMPLKWINLTYGGKTSSSTNNSDVTFYDLSSGFQVFDSNQSNQFVYKENINALYFSGTKKIGDKWEIQTGLRMETTNTESISVTLNQTNKNNYTQFFPTVYVTYAKNENNTFSLNYSKRINRPSFFSLNPFRWIDNQFSYTEGNPFLQPSFSNNFELSFTRNQNWESKLYYSSTNNGYAQLTTLDANTNIQATRYENYFNTQIAGLSESYTFTKFKWWESVNSLDINYSNSDSKVIVTNQNLRGFNYYFSTNNTFNLNTAKTIIFNFNYWLSPRGVSNLSEDTASNQLDLSLKFLLLNKNLQLGINGNDVLSSNRPTSIYYANNIKQEYKNYYDNRFFRISISYKFGNNKIKVDKRNFGNEEEKNRVN